MLLANKDSFSFEKKKQREGKRESQEGKAAGREEKEKKAAPALPSHCFSSQGFVGAGFKAVRSVCRRSHWGHRPSPETSGLSVTTPTAVAWAPVIPSRCFPLPFFFSGNRAKIPSSQVTTQIN